MMCETQYTHYVALAWNIRPKRLALTYFDNFKPNHNPIPEILHCHYLIATLNCLPCSKTHTQASVPLSLVISLFGSYRFPFIIAK